MLAVMATTDYWMGAVNGILLSERPTVGVFLIFVFLFFLIVSHLFTITEED